MNDLAFIRATFQGLIDMSRELSVDASERPVWQQILDHLSPYPTGERGGKQVFLAAEAGEDKAQLTSTIPDWGTLATWPANQVGLGLDPALLEIARNTVAERGFTDHPLVPPAMARVGSDPVKLLAAMRKDVLEHGYPNGYMFFFGGGVESASMIPSTINEMLLQSYSGVIRLFPDWPRNQDAGFTDLRAYGAFLVSSELTNGRVGSVAIVSEKGRRCVVENPWPGKSIALDRNGKRAETLHGDRLQFNTAAGERISIDPL